MAYLLGIAIHSVENSRRASSHLDILGKRNAELLNILDIFIKLDKEICAIP